MPSFKNERIRYPIQDEMEKCFPNLESEIKELKPTIVFLLGKQVSTFIAKKYLITIGALTKISNTNLSLLMI